MEANITFILAPLHGITNYHFRNCLHRHVEGIDVAVTPFLAAQELAKLNVRKWLDIQPANNTGMPIIPQLMGNDPRQMTDTLKALSTLGYQQVNWNIGCPSAQVVRKQRGCGLMPHADKVEAVVAAAIREVSECRLSVKMRTGWANPTEGLEIIERLNPYPIDFIAIHPRLGVQEYNGTPDWEMFREMCEKTRHRIVYSGDIVDLDSYRRFRACFPNVTYIMLGRGILRNIFLAEELTAGETLPLEVKRRRFADFYHDLIETLAEARGRQHILSLLKELWHYFATFYQLSPQELVTLLRITDIDEFERRVGEFM